MTYYAKVNEGRVVEVIVADAQFIETYSSNKPGRWVDAKTNKVSIGDNYDAVRERFVPPKPLDSWVLDETTMNWMPPVAYPESGGPYVWNEENLEWQLSVLKP
jgi:hypothetical protein